MRHTCHEGSVLSTKPDQADQPQPTTAHLVFLARLAAAILPPFLLLLPPPLRLLVGGRPAAARCWAAAALPHHSCTLPARPSRSLGPRRGAAAAGPCRGLGPWRGATAAPRRCRLLPAGRPAWRGAPPQRHLEAGAVVVLQPLKLCGGRGGQRYRASASDQQQLKQPLAAVSAQQQLKGWELQAGRLGSWQPPCNNQQGSFC